MQTSTTFALLADITPNRATVLVVGSEDECLDSEHGEASIVPVREGLTVKAGERVWIRRNASGTTVLEVAANA